MKVMMIMILMKIREYNFVVVTQGEFVSGSRIYKVSE